MTQQIVVFERDERYTESGQPELDCRLVRGALPKGASPLAVADGPDFRVVEGQWFTHQQVCDYAEQQSGFTAQRLTPAQMSRMI